MMMLFIIHSQCGSSSNGNAEELDLLLYSVDLLRCVYLEVKFWIGILVDTQILVDSCVVGMLSLSVRLSMFLLLNNFHCDFCLRSLIIY
jgi:hypothetical protein